MVRLSVGVGIGLTKARGRPHFPQIADGSGSAAELCASRQSMIKRDDAQTCAQRRSVGTFVELASDEADGPKTRRGDRLFLDAVIYRLKTGVPWRDSRAVLAVEVGLQSVCQLVSDEGCGGHILSRYSSTSMTRVRSSTLSIVPRTKTLRAEKGSRPIV